MNAKTDFNDLASAEGLQAVKAQLQDALAGASDWPPPITRAAQPPALSADLLPSWLGQYVAALAAATQTPVTMSLPFALSVLAACVQRRYAVAPHGEASDYREALSFWSLSVAASGSRKSAIVEALTRPLNTWERQARTQRERFINDTWSRIQVSEARIKNLQARAGKTDNADESEQLREQIQKLKAETPKPEYLPQLWSGDCTVERLQQMLVEQNGRASVLSDEGGLFATLSGTYGGGAGPSLDVLLQGHSGGAVRVDRASREAHIDRAAVTLGLMLQPDLVNEAAGSSRFRASGLMARFAYAIPAPFVGGRDVRAYSTIPDDLVKTYASAIHGLLGDPADGPHAAPLTLPLQDEARESWLDFAQEIEDQLGESGALGAISDWAAKLAGTCARVAALFELVTTGPTATSVGADSVQQAVALCRQLVPHAQAAFRLLAADQVDRDADAILDWMVRNDRRVEFKQNEVHTGLHGRFTTRERLGAALLRLASRNCLRYEQRKNKGARPSDWWVVNPRLFVQDMQ